MDPTILSVGMDRVVIQFVPDRLQKNPYKSLYVLPICLSSKSPNSYFVDSGYVFNFFMFEENIHIFSFQGKHLCADQAQLMCFPEIVSPLAWACDFLF